MYLSNFDPCFAVETRGFGLVCLSWIVLNPGNLPVLEKDGRFWTLKASNGHFVGRRLGPSLPFCFHCIDSPKCWNRSDSPLRVRVFLFAGCCGNRRVASISEVVCSISEVALRSAACQVHFTGGFRWTITVHICIATFIRGSFYACVHTGAAAVV